MANAPKVPGSFVVVMLLALEYGVICGLCSFMLGQLAFLLCIIFLLLQAAMAFVVAGDALQDHHPAKQWLVLLWGLTACAAAFIGGRNFHASYAPYWTASGGQYYAGISASALAASHADAGIIQFEEGTKLDETLAVGLRVAGHTYCVAPVRDPNKDLTVEDPVQFWAVGLDCCGGRGSFDCDDAANAEARGGMVLQEPVDQEEALTAVIFAPRIYRQAYGRAVNASVALHDELTTASPAVFLRWLATPEKNLNGWFACAILVWALSTILYCTFMAVAWAGIVYKVYGNINIANANLQGAREKIMEPISPAPSRRQSRSPRP